MLLQVNLTRTDLIYTVCLSTRSTRFVYDTRRTQIITRNINVGDRQGYKVVRGAWRLRVQHFRKLVAVPGGVVEL